MAAASNGTLKHENYYDYPICLEGLVMRTTVTLHYRHTFHLDCLGFTFNTRNVMRCSVCRAVEGGIWRSFSTRAPRSSRTGARVTRKMCRSSPSEG